MEINEKSRVVVVQRTVAEDGRPILVILGAAEDVQNAKKLIKTLGEGVFSILSFNEVDITTRPPERVSTVVLTKGTTFGKPRGPQAGKPRKERKAKGNDTPTAT